MQVSAPGPGPRRSAPVGARLVRGAGPSVPSAGPSAPGTDLPDPGADVLAPGTADDEHVALATEVFSLLSDETRVRLILALEDGELPVGVLASRVGRPPTAVSQHLAKLRWARVVATRQEGTRVYYRLVDEHARTLIHQALFQAEHMVDEVPAHHRAVARTAATAEGAAS